MSAAILSVFCRRLFDAMEPVLAEFLGGREAVLDSVEIRLGLRRKDDPKARAPGSELRTKLDLDLLTAKDREKERIEAAKLPIPIDSKMIASALDEKLSAFEEQGYLSSPWVVVKADGPNRYVVSFEKTKSEPS